MTNNTDQPDQTDQLISRLFKCGCEISNAIKYYRMTYVHYELHELHEHIMFDAVHATCNFCELTNEYSPYKTYIENKQISQQDIANDKMFTEKCRYCNKDCIAQPWEFCTPSCFKKMRMPREEGYTEIYK